MAYIALALMSILAILFGVSHEEQKHKTYTYKKLVYKLRNENAKLRAKMMTEKEWNEMTDHALQNIH